MVILDNKERKIITAGLLVKLYLNPHARRLNKKYRRNREKLLLYILHWSSKLIKFEVKIRTTWINQSNRYKSFGIRFLQDMD